MKQQWAPQELIDHWTLTREEIRFVTTVSKTGYNQVGCAVLLKCFQMQGKFSQHILYSYYSGLFIAKAFWGVNGEVLKCDFMVLRQRINNVRCVEHAVQNVGEGIINFCGY